MTITDKLAGEKKLFDAEAYVLAYPELRLKAEGAWAHYAAKGKNDGCVCLTREMADAFDAASYIFLNPDLEECTLPLWIHWHTKGKAAGRQYRKLENLPVLLAASMNTAFSIILPTYNRAYCLMRTIRSILAQTHRNFELLIVDDGSTDDTEEMVRKLFHPHLTSGRIRYLRREHVGCAAARNAGLKHALYPWIAYADSDDTYSRHHLRAFANHIALAPGKNCFYAGFNRTSKKLKFKAFNYDAFLKKNNNTIHIGAFVHRLALVTKLGGFDESLRRLVDYDLFLSYLRKQAPQPVPLMLYTYHDDAREDRISIAEDVETSRRQIERKHCPHVAVCLFAESEKNVQESVAGVLAQKYVNVTLWLFAPKASAWAQPLLAQAKGLGPIDAVQLAPLPECWRQNIAACLAQPEDGSVAPLLAGDCWTHPEHLFRSARYLMDHLEVDANLYGCRFREPQGILSDRTTPMNKSDVTTPGTNYRPYALSSMLLRHAFALRLAAGGADVLAAESPGGQRHPQCRHRPSAHVE